MIGVWFLGALLQALVAAMNTSFYASDGKPVHLLFAVFFGLYSIGSFLVAARTA